jgi:uncharacterized protein YbbC (DUF1343 family)
MGLQLGRLLLAVSLLLVGSLDCTPSPKVRVGADRLFEAEFAPLFQGKKIGLVTNHTGLDSRLRSTVELFEEHKSDCTLVTLFSPEHGLGGSAYAGEEVAHGDRKEVVLYSLHGKQKRPTEAMLEGLDLVVFDIQEIGCRSYTYATTLYYLMEEAAKKNLPVVVLDRPNPINGLIVDGPMLHDEQRSFLGYVNVPYCHGMTIGELARFFNEEYHIRCALTIVPMEGWHRGMGFADTGLHWIATSPHIPEPDTPLFYATTGILGELGLVNIGVGYTQPFKLVGAPWIDAEVLTRRLNDQKVKGVRFLPTHYRPFYGLYEGQECHGIKIVVTDLHAYRPLTVQYLVLGMLKTLYPQRVDPFLNALPAPKKTAFCQVNGNTEMLDLITRERYVAWKLIQFDQGERQKFLERRKKYLLYPE